MKWFEGSIKEAVATSKSKKAIFVVFVEGKDDTSVQVAEAINATEVSRRLEQDDFLAIRLESGSETYRFFAQIYQLVPVPSLFFIGENGTPLEIIAGSTTAADLSTKIDLILTKAGKNKNASLDMLNEERKATAAASSVATVSNLSIDVDKEDDSTIESKNVEVPSTETVSVNDSSNVNRSNVQEEPSTSLETEPQKSVNEIKEEPAKELTKEEKIERARQLIEVQKKQRIEEEEKKEKEREILRRKIGRDVQKIRQKQQDLEMKQLYEERMKEKAAELIARERVLQQIAQDKLERKQKQMMMQQQQEQKQSDPEPSETPTFSATISRIQFRLPSGNPYVAQFEPTNTLRDLRSYVVENIDLPFRQFAMSTSFPRRELTHEDDDKSLLELELVPTAVILILPLKNTNPTTTVTSAQDVGVVSRFMWSTFAIFSAVYYYVIGWWTGGRKDKPKQSPENRDTETNASGTINSNIQNVASSSGVVRRYLGNRGGTTIKTEGNIHRLHSGGDDNDENNTWNGNSTQQM